MPSLPLDSGRFRGRFPGSRWNVRQRRNLGCPNEAKGLPDFRISQRGQQYSESAGIDHFRTEMGLITLVAHDDARPRSRSSDSPHGGGQTQVQCSGLYQHGDHGTRPPDFCEAG